MLHTVNKSPLERDAFDSCLRHALAGDVIVLIEDGVYGAVAGTTFAPRLQQALARLNVYALSPDVDARGLRAKIQTGVVLVDYSGFVDLVVQHSPVMAW